ncbi:PWWP domain [Dillenia turbinata]|uniref:PWWP domain n=1 Tax=Dillenia turbinata TaxID=194707 RepID=A0AAN8VGW0_9MAGN
MGSSGSSKGTGGGGGGVVDNTVGSIVWVRRRNGSWWPGKILGPDELSASHLMSPRSGTPVKLLGREDASVFSMY